MTTTRNSDAPTGHNVTHLGQVFTPPQVVSQMLSLRCNSGRVLEPSSGNGAFSTLLPDCVALEIDALVATPDAHLIDFFSYPTTEQFDTIIGNPPYVRYRDIAPATKKHLDHSLFNRRSNLYLFFIEKCIRHLRVGGELIFIVPRDFIKLTSAQWLNEWLFQQGSITDFIEMGDTPLFGAYVPNCAIFRFERGCYNRVMHDGRTFAHVAGQLLFLHQSYTIPFSDHFTVKVGAVSGADDIYTHPQGNMEFICSHTAQTNETQRMIYGIYHPALMVHKQRLLARRVRLFNHRNWWLWGRQHHISDAPRIYVNAKTRNKKPFFIHPCKNYDGSILAIFPKNQRLPLKKTIRWLNSEINWHELGFVCDERYLFSQRALQTCLLPESFLTLIERSSKDALR